MRIRRVFLRWGIPVREWNNKYFYLPTFLYKHIQVIILTIVTQKRNINVIA